MIGELTQEEIRQVLSENYVGRLGCHSEGVTYVVPVGFVLDGERLIGQTTLGMKVEMMRDNPSVCFQTDQVHGLDSWKSVIVWGDYQEIPPTERPAAARLLIDRLSERFAEDGRSPRDVTPEKLAGKYEGVLYAITIRKMTGRFETPN